MVREFSVEDSRIADPTSPVSGAAGGNGHTAEAHRFVGSKPRKSLSNRSYRLATAATRSKVQRIQRSLNCVCACGRPSSFGDQNVFSVRVGSPGTPASDRVGYINVQCELIHWLLNRLGRRRSPGRWRLGGWIAGYQTGLAGPAIALWHDIRKSFCIVLKKQIWR